MVCKWFQANQAYNQGLTTGIEKIHKGQMEYYVLVTGHWSLVTVTTTTMTASVNVRLLVAEKHTFRMFDPHLPRS